MNMNNLEQATFGAGCFWCVEAVFQRLKGVESVVSGYTGGQVKNPTYKQVCSGDTGHAEVIQINFNPEIISYSDLLDVFWDSHDPTTLNRQGADAGTQYRSVIYYHDENQKQIILESKNKINESGYFSDLIVTEISPIETFYPAEDYHQNYYNENTSQPYCSFVITPKVKNLQKKYSEKLKA